MVDVEHLEAEAAVVDALGRARHLAQHVHQETGDGLELVIVGEGRDAEQGFEVANRSEPVDQPGIVVAADDLRLVGSIEGGADQRRGDIVERDQADDQRVFVDDQREVLARCLELFEDIFYVLIF